MVHSLGKVDIRRMSVGPAAEALEPDLLVFESHYCGIEHAHAAIAAAFLAPGVQHLFPSFRWRDPIGIRDNPLAVRVAVVCLPQASMRGYSVFFEAVRARRAVCSDS